MARIIKSIQFGDQILTLETGEIARQAESAVLVSMQDTVVLVTVVSKPHEGSADFFPLTVHYQEKSYAAGRIPGGFVKREGRPTENEVLISRLMDRPIRPLFPKGFNTEVQVLATVLSFNPSVNPDVLSMIGASAALALTDMPFGGPIGVARVGYKDGIYLLNPSPEVLAASDLDLVVAGTENAVLMVESEADELAESVMLGAVVYGHTMMQEVIKGIREFTEQVRTSGMTRLERSRTWQPVERPADLMNMVAQCESPIGEAYHIADKTQRNQKLQDIRDQLVAQVKAIESETASGVERERLVQWILDDLEKTIVRKRIIGGEPRIDGRDTKTVRPIQIRLGLLPRTHGSALFTRGETQAIVVATLGSERDAQMIDSIHGEAKQRFMLHYNFPPYSVGEVGPIMAPKRREIGHGRLAWRALSAVIPKESEFPYVLRVVSDITESNGSSSMATVCGASLALMDAGVPIKSPVAGIAMGLVKEGDQFKVLTDILGDEDHLGDMDFKVAGTEKGVTALQMDIKIDGITAEIMTVALEQAQEARLHILNIMKQSLGKPREVISEYAPRITTIRVPVDKIGDIIGKGGSTIRALTEETGVSIDIADDGVVKIFAADQNAADAATKRIEQLIEEVAVGKIYEGRVTKIVEFGAFVNILPGKDGLLHISQITTERVKNVSDYLQEGQIIQVKVLEVDRQGRIKLSMKEITVQSEV